jgi:hypothetical protein
MAHKVTRNAFRKHEYPNCSSVFEVPVAVSTKVTVVQGVTPCSLVHRSQKHFGID